MGFSLNTFQLQYFFESFFCISRIIKIVQLFNHFRLTLELESEFEFDGLLCIVTRAIYYSKQLSFTKIYTIFFALKLLYIPTCILMCILMC